MEVKKMTDAAMLSAVFIVVSMLAIGLGLGYFGYVDFIVPVFMAIIYLKCGLRYAILSSITSLILIIFVIGDLPSGIMMVQSMILGIFLSTLMSKEENIFDDLFYSSIFACILVIVVDINFSALTGYSLLKECQGYLNYLPSSYNNYKEIVFYIGIAALPLGTVILCYILTLTVSRQFKILNHEVLKKRSIISNYRMYAHLLSCSKKTIHIGIIYIIIFMILKKFQLLINMTYINIVLNCIEYIVLLFILQDSFSMINKTIYAMTKSRVKLILIQFIILYMIVKLFEITSVVMIISGFLVDKKYNIRIKQERILSVAFI